MENEDKEKLDRLWGKILEYCNNPRIRARVAKTFERLDSDRASQAPIKRLPYLQVDLRSAGSIEASFAAADFYTGDIPSALARINKSVMYLYSSIRSSYEFWRIRSDQRILNHPTADILICLSGSYLLGYSAESGWLARKAVESHAKEEHWVLSGGYLSDFLISLALAASDGLSSGHGRFATTDVVQKLFDTDTDKSALYRDCVQARFSDAYRVQMNILEEDFLHYGIAGMPLELLAYRELHEHLSGEKLDAPHESMLPAFEAIIGARDGFSDRYVAELQQLTLSMTKSDISVQE